VSFAAPIWLLALLALPLLVAAYLLYERRRERAAAAFGNPALFPNVVDRSPGWRRHLPVAVLLVGLAAMVVGVARPQATVHVKREEATVVLAVDTSRSMAATDVQPSRLAAAATTADAFLKQVPKRFRVALVSFASRAVLAVAPTEDRAQVEAAFRSLAPGEGTALGDALALSADVVRKQRTSDGATPPAALLLVSDGAPDGGTTALDKAIQRAKQAHLPVYTVLVGTASGTVEETLTGGYRATVQVPAAPQTLQRIASETGGKFFSAPTESDLRNVYDRLGSRLGTRARTRELTDATAAVSALLVLGGVALSLVWFGRPL
jgi:Ca-activated chloride channel family protein